MLHFSGKDTTMKTIFAICAAVMLTTSLGACSTLFAKDEEPVDPAVIMDDDPRYPVVPVVRG